MEENISFTEAKNTSAMLRFFFYTVNIEIYNKNNRFYLVAGLITSFRQHPIRSGGGGGGGRMGGGGGANLTSR